MRRLCLCLILSFVAPVLADDPPMPFTGKVVKVTDGDTILVLLDKETHKIRLLHSKAKGSSDPCDVPLGAILRSFMDSKPPLPVCKAFLICRQISGETLTLIGQSNCHVNRRFPSSCQLSFFARLKGGHGRNDIEVQMQDVNGAVVWRDGPLEPWCPASPLDTIDMTLNLLPIFPGPGDYSLVLTANDEELAREPFAARLTSQLATT